MQAAIDKAAETGETVYVGPGEYLCDTLYMRPKVSIKSDPLWGFRRDELGRAIITMTLTTPACPLTDLIEDECASTLAGLVEEFRIDWTWTPRWSVEKITPEGREQLAALGFNLDSMPTY